MASTYDQDVNVVNMSSRTPSTGTDRARRAGRYHHGDLRRALTAAALELIGERGPKGFTLTEVARRAGVSVAAPYRHFADKADLLATVAAVGFAELHTALLAGPDPGAGSDRLVELGRRYVRWAVEHPDYYLLMFGAEVKGADHPQLRRAADDALGVLLGALEEAGVAVDDRPALAGSLWSVVHGAAALEIGGDLRHAGIQPPAEDLAAAAIGALTAARPGPDAGRPERAGGR